MISIILSRPRFSKEIKLKRYFNQELVDTTGACLSFACAFHCMATPFLVAVLPFIGLSFLIGERAEFVLIIIAAVLATGSLVWGVRYHGSWQVFLILGAAVAFIVIGRTVIEGSYTVVFHTASGILLASAHLVNRYLCKICSACEVGDV